MPASVQTMLALPTLATPRMPLWSRALPTWASVRPTGVLGHHHDLNGRVHIRGPVGSAFHSGQVKLDGAIVSKARCLGGQHHFNNGFSPEKPARLAAIDKAW